MSDIYKNFKCLSAVEKEYADFLIFTENIETPVAIVAPHGGGIEPGTSEIAKSISRGKCKCYCFEGIKSKGNREILHITSTKFDEPNCIAMCQSSDTIVTVHGSSDEDEIIYVGGLNEELKKAMIEKLEKAGFTTKEDNTEHSGKNAGNLCNKGRSKQGLQLEISKGLRKKMFKGMNRGSRKFTNEIYESFIKTVQSALEIDR